MLRLIAFSRCEQQKDTCNIMIYIALLVLILLLCQLFFTHLFTSRPLNRNFLCGESNPESPIMSRCGWQCSADVRPELGATARDKRKGGGDGCSVCAHASERARQWEGGKERAHMIFPACKSLRTMSTMVCSHSQHKGEKNTVTAVAQGRILSSQRSGACSSCHRLCPELTEASVPAARSWVSKRIWDALAGSITPPSPERTCTKPFRLPFGLQLYCCFCLLLKHPQRAWGGLRSRQLGWCS